MGIVMGLLAGFYIGVLFGFFMAALLRERAVAKWKATAEERV